MKAKKGMKKKQDSALKNSTVSVKSKNNLSISKSSIVIGSLIVLLVLALGIFLFLKNSTPEVDIGDRVSVWYVGKLQNGEVFDTNVESVAVVEGIDLPSYEPLEFIAGMGQMIKGFDNAVIGMKQGEKKTVTIPPQEAYGSYVDYLIKSFSIEEFEEMFFPIEEAEIGMVIPVQFSDGRVGTVVLSQIGTNFVTLDQNHELAGKTLIFDIEVISVIK